MPWDQSYNRIRSLPAQARKVWVEVANKELGSHGDEGRAEASGWAAVKNAGYEKSGHLWTKKAATKEVVSKQETDMKNRFTAGVRITKARQGDGEMYVTVTASGVKTDRQGEKMDPGFLEKVFKMAKDGEMGLRESHASVFDLGRSVTAGLQPNGDADFEFKLDKSNPLAPYLFERVQKGDAKEQASLDGYSTDRGFEWDDKLQKMVKVLKDGVIKFVALTPPGESAYPTAGLTEAIVKQVSWDKEPEPPARVVPPVLPVKKAVAPGGGTVDEMITQLEGFAEAITKSMAPSFKPEPHMFQEVAGAVILRKDFQEQYDQSKPVVTDAQRQKIEKSLEKILNAIGTPTVDLGKIRKGKPAAPKGNGQAVLKLRKALGLDTLVASVESVKKILDATKGRPAVPGPENKIRKDLPGGETPLADASIEDITKSMQTLGAAVRSGKVSTAPELDQARNLADTFLKAVAAKAIEQDMQSVGVVSAQ